MRHKIFICFSNPATGSIPLPYDYTRINLRKFDTKSTQGTAISIQATAAADSFDNAAFFLEKASQLLAQGVPIDSPEVAQWVDFATRKLWQGTEELGGREFTVGAECF